MLGVDKYISASNLAYLYTKLVGNMEAQIFIYNQVSEMAILFDGMPQHSKDALQKLKEEEKSILEQIKSQKCLT